MRYLSVSNVESWVQFIDIREDLIHFSGGSFGSYKLIPLESTIKGDVDMKSVVFNLNVHPSRQRGGGGDQKNHIDIHFNCHNGLGGPRTILWFQSGWCCIWDPLWTLFINISFCKTYARIYGPSNWCGM